MVPLVPPSSTRTFPFVSGEYRIRHARESWERRACLSLRKTVFCEEQRLFENHDEDEADGRAIIIAAIACVASIPERVVGTVRIHSLAPRCWQGSRLAVDRDYRGVAWIGTELIRHAVGTAKAKGCERFIAQVQPQNLRLFQSLRWEADGVTSLRGRTHIQMHADLAHYPERADIEVRFFTSGRQAA